MILDARDPFCAKPSFLLAVAGFWDVVPRAVHGEEKGLATPASRPCRGLRRTPAYAQERRPCYRLGRTRRPRALVPGVEACGSRRSAKGARGDRRQHTCPCPSFDCHADGFPRRDPSQMQLPALLLRSFRGSPRHHSAAEASRAADDVERRRRRVDATAATSHAARCNRLRSLFSVGADTFAFAPCM